MNVFLNIKYLIFYAKLLWFATLIHYFGFMSNILRFCLIFHVFVKYFVSLYSLLGALNIWGPHPHCLAQPSPAQPSPTPGSAPCPTLVVAATFLRFTNVYCDMVCSTSMPPSKPRPQIMPCPRPTTWPMPQHRGLDAMSRAAEQKRHFVTHMCPVLCLCMCIFISIFICICISTLFVYVLPFVIVLGLVLCLCLCQALLPLSLSPSPSLPLYLSLL